MKKVIDFECIVFYRLVLRNYHFFINNVLKFMSIILFLFQFMARIDCWILFIFFKHPKIHVDIKIICRYSYNRYPHKYGYWDETDIYLTGKMRESYNSYVPYLSYWHSYTLTNLLFKIQLHSTTNKFEVSFLKSIAHMQKSQ